jgi:hypothetical protein
VRNQLRDLELSSKDFKSSEKGEISGPRGSNSEEQSKEMYECMIYFEYVDSRPTEMDVSKETGSGAERA